MNNREQALRVVEVARQIVAGQLGLLEGARELSRLRFDVADDADPDFMFFVALDSETDHLPVGSVRAEWAEDALREKDEEIRRVETEARDEAILWCEKLIDRFAETRGAIGS